MKCWPIIRHIRWFILTIRFNMWWASVGRHLGAFPNQSDIRFLDDVWRGAS